ncbi:hypothetical protein CNMCM6106_006785 [Aspergillus hiratsukae]|uniref:Amino acid transporter transmembrane domain-containing protein n=1 Tax=Aspergillus hiratsukae TaxID=1194566 RepID=A0A8H6V3L6_9EURO|nr:hypothetical protein CNMCM6106_006785 [Aspergillus hiratsukae]
MSQTINESNESKESKHPEVDLVECHQEGTLETLNALIAEDHQHEIKLRTMSWHRAAWLLAGDQVCLAIMAQSWSLSVLGWVPGIITMLVACILFWVTSITMHEFIMRHPQIMDICDFGYYAFGKSRITYAFTAFMLLANNIFLIGFHILTGAKILNTLSDHSLSAFMGLAILLFLIFVGIEDAPLYGYNGDYPTQGPVRTYAFPLPGTSWVACTNAVLNIIFLWVPQALFPTFISEMERPQDFPKSPAVLAAISAVLFIVPPAIGFRYLGQYATAPAFGSLGVTAYKKASFAFVIVPTLVIAVIYTNVAAKFVYFRVMRNSTHAHRNTIIGWGVWGASMVGIWVIAFVLAEVIPSMGDFLSLSGSAFGSFFGFIFYAVVYWQMHKGGLFAGVGRSIMTGIHGIVLLCGLFLLGPGLYAAVEAVIADYSGGTRPAFSCANAAI